MVQPLVEVEPAAAAPEPEESPAEVWAAAVKPPPKCPCVSAHRPEPKGLDTHHILPLSWGGPDVAANRIDICPTTHRNVHDLLRLMVKTQQWPPREVLMGYSKFARALVGRCIEANGGIPPRATIPRAFGGTAPDGPADEPVGEAGP